MMMEGLPSDPPPPPVPETPGIELKFRADRLRMNDPVGAARALVELGIYAERVERDRDEARKHYDAARALVRTLQPALCRVHRLLDARGDLAQLVATIDDEIAVAEGDAPRAELLGERARCYERMGALAEARASYEEALRLVPEHGRSLRGLEAVLRKELQDGPNKERATQLANHLEHLAEAYAPSSERVDGDNRLASWCCVDRAEVLDELLDQQDHAQAALERAVSSQTSPGPVRDAYNRHLVRHGRDSALVASLSNEAEQERDQGRASRLLYTASRVVIDKLRAPADAVVLLTRASPRASVQSPTSSRIMAELIRQLEATGNLEASAQVRQKRQSQLTERDQIVHEYVRLSEIFTTLGHADKAAENAAEALRLDPNDAATRERLDRALQRMGRHRERVQMWVTEANSDRPIDGRLDAYFRAADIAERQLGKPDEAIAHLRAAWSIDPQNARALDMLSALLAPASKDAEENARGVRERIELYSQAVHSTNDPARKIGLLEKLVSIWEDELGQPARAIDEIDRILEIDPKRRTSILALQRNAERAGDAKRLARALREEADLTQDPGLERRLLLAASEVLADRIGDRERASELIERALRLDPNDVPTLRAQFQLQEKQGRYDDARSTLQALIAPDPGSTEAFQLWLEVARLDEGKRKNPHDAVSAYRAAAKIKPLHPLPPLEIIRLLREVADFDKLVESLVALARDAEMAEERARLMFQAAEVQEFSNGDDAAALERLADADRHASDSLPDPAILEATERILVRMGSGPELTALYARWLERQPPANVDHGLRLALAGVLSKTHSRQACDVLRALVSVVPDHVPALRRLERLYRELGDHSELATALLAEADVFASNLARCGALWELVGLEEEVGAQTTLDALTRIIVDAPRDMAALDATIRVAGRLCEGPEPHPTAQHQLLTALHARRELTVEDHARAAYQLEEAVLNEAMAEHDEAAAHAALGCYRDALILWEDSMLAARGLDRLATRLGDRKSIIRSQLALARLVEAKSARAEHLVRAAMLTLERGEADDRPAAVLLHEQALRIDPDNGHSVEALVTMLATDPARLADRLGEALDRARTNVQIVRLGMSIGRTVLGAQEANLAAAVAELPKDISALLTGGATEKVTDYGTGIAAMRRVLEVVAEDVDALLLMSKLLSAQQVWAEAREMLLRVVDLAPDPATRVAAHFSLAQIYEGPLSELDLAETALVSALAIEPQNKHALERLHQIAIKKDDRPLVISVLERLAEYESEPAVRAGFDLRLADAYRDSGDQEGMIRALCDATVATPKDLRPWNLLAQNFRLESSDGAAAYAQALQQVIDLATTRRLPIDPRWFMTLGMIEVNVMRQPAAGVEHLSRAAGLGAPPEMRVALGQGLVAAGRNAEAAQTLRDLITTDGEQLLRLAEPSAYVGIRAACVAPSGTVLAAALSSLESALSTEGRQEERLAVEEARACLGEVSNDRVHALRARRLKPDLPFAGALAGGEFARLLVPEARSPLIDVAVALAPVAAKALRFELSALGVGSRDRIGARDGHPTRALAERVARTLGIEEFELYLAPQWQGAARVFPGDPACIVGPANFPDLPEPEQFFALSRLLTRIALGVTWLDELSVEAADGLLLATLRAVEPLFGVGEVAGPREQALQNFLQPVQKAIGRRQRKLIEELLPNTSPGYDARAFMIGVRRTEYRAAYVMSGDLVCAVDYMRRFDRELSRAAESPRVLLQHPVTNELIRYAMTPDAYNERRRLGTVWASR